MSKAIMRQIQARDPDGGTRQPTEADYAAFRAWVTRRFGEKAWAEYHGVWDEEDPV